MKKIFATLVISMFVSSAISNANEVVNQSSLPETTTEECVLANSNDIYEVKCYAGEECAVLVSGDGDTDLDLYIYDQYGNLVAYDDDTTDTMYASWKAKRSGIYKIKIVNRGSVRNYYTMWTY